MSGDEISDRHLRPIDGLSNSAGPTGLRVRVLAETAASTFSGQHLLVCLTNLLCRMTEIVASIEFEIPKAQVIVALPHIAEPSDLILKSVFGSCTGADRFGPVIVASLCDRPT